MTRPKYKRKYLCQKIYSFILFNVINIGYYYSCCCCWDCCCEINEDDASSAETEKHVS